VHSGLTQPERRVNELTTFGEQNPETVRSLGVSGVVRLPVPRLRLVEFTGWYPRGMFDFMEEFRGGRTGSSRMPSFW
jgi:hypothetical protein